MIMSIQWWLGVLLDFLSNVLVLGMALFAASFNNWYAPIIADIHLISYPGLAVVVLAYALNVTQFFCEYIFSTSFKNISSIEFYSGDSVTICSGRTGYECSRKDFGVHRA